MPDLDTLLDSFDNPDNQEKVDKALAEMVKHAKSSKEEEVPPEEMELKDFVEGGGNLRTKIGLRFSRDKDGALSEAYTGSRAKKQEFRKQWAEAKLKDLEQIRERRSSFKRVDKRKGTYKPVSMIWLSQGGKYDKNAMAATKNIVQRCLAMQGDWVRFNPMSQRCEFLVLEEGFEEVFEEKWSLFERRSERPEAPAQKGENKAAKLEKGTREGDDEGEKIEKKPKEKNALDQALATASSVKKDYEKIRSTAHSLLRRMQMDAGWEWASTEAVKLNKAVHNTEAALNEFGNFYLTADLKEVRRAYRDRMHLMQAELENLTRLKSPLQVVQVQTRMISVMDNARRGVIAQPSPTT